ncbi:hypothetical protein JOM56_011921, partial [Amanita muscaria]
AEVQYYFTWMIENENRALAMASFYSEPDMMFFKNSYESLWVSKYLGEHGYQVIDAKCIQAVVAMIPFPLTQEELEQPEIKQKYENAFFMGEKPWLETSQGHSDELEEDGEDFVL